LRTASGRTTLPGYGVIDSEYREFKARLPAIAIGLGFKVDDLPLSEYRTIVEEVVLQQLYFD